MTSSRWTRLAQALLLLGGAPSVAAPAAAAAAAVEVRKTGAVAIRAAGVPAAEVVSELARQADIEVVYAAIAPPPQPLTLDLTAANVAEAVTRLMDHLGLNYAMKSRGGRVHMLIIVGASQVRPSPPSAPPPPEPSEDDELFGMARPLAEPTTTPPPGATRAPRRERPASLDPPGAPRRPWPSRGDSKAR